jgi:hypothetical protein
MADRYLVKIEAWPHSTGRGQKADQKDAGERVQTFVVRAVGMDEALANANYIAQGMRTNPMVWRAPVVEIRQESEQ